MQNKAASNLESRPAIVNDNFTQKVVIIVKFNNQLTAWHYKNSVFCPFDKGLRFFSLILSLHFITIWQIKVLYI